MWEEARRLGNRLDSFVAEVAADTNTHDGYSRGDLWRERDGGATELRKAALLLRTIATTWERG